MKRMILKTFLIFMIFSPVLFPQRSENNKGVDFYDEEKFTDAEINFKKGLEEVPESFEATFNLGDSYYKQGRYEEAVQSFNSSLELTDQNELKAKAHHNIGNSLLKGEKLKESVEAYKNALKINPNDKETKYNLSYALSLLDDQKNQQQQNKNDQNKNDQNKENQSKDKQNQDNQQNKDQNKNEQQQNKPNQQQEAQQDNLKQPKQEISKEEAERILQALRNEEKDLQKKLRKKIGNPVRREKDW